MYNTLFYALLFLVIPLGFFSLFSWAIIYHIMKYGFKPGANRRVTALFAFVMIALSLFIVQNFFSVDWSRASLEDFMSKSHINIFNGGTYGYRR